ncbi:MAG: YkgJ family cysteine cluster protein [Epsilonproteobacteria bacterium]|nr:YkgJ family cysteine cluster protein [Campylobacterota bacterium]
MSIISQEGYSFKFDSSKCFSCNGACCRGESGKVWVLIEEMEKIANFLGIELEEFKRDFVKKEGERYSLKEIKVKGEYLCIFFNPSTCRCEIYPIRPLQCKQFPFWPSLKNKKNLYEVCKECKAILLS